MSLELSQKTENRPFDFNHYFPNVYLIRNSEDHLSASIKEQLNALGIDYEARKMMDWQAVPVNVWSRLSSVLNESEGSKRKQIAWKILNNEKLTDQERIDLKELKEISACYLSHREVILETIEKYHKALATLDELKKSPCSSQKLDEVAKKVAKYSSLFIFDYDVMFCRSDSKDSTLSPKVIKGRLETIFKALPDDWEFLSLYVRDYYKYLALISEDLFQRSKFTLVHPGVAVMSSTYAISSKMYADLEKVLKEITPKEALNEFHPISLELHRVNLNARDAGRRYLLVPTKPLMYRVSEVQAENLEGASYDYYSVTKHLSVSNEINQSALTIQKAVRGKLGRKKASLQKGKLLDYSLFQKALTYTGDPLKLAGLERSTVGLSMPYFLEDPPVVIKKSIVECKERFEKIMQAKDVLEKYGLDLVIPKARLSHSQYIIEERLPIDVNYKQQIGLYLENLKLFNKPVRDFTTFLFVTTLADISGSIYEVFQKVSKPPVARFDNVPIYIDQSGVTPSAKIALIDLDYFSPICDKSEADWSLNRCLDAIRFFPHHMHTIIEVAKEFDPDIGRHFQALKTEREQVLAYFDVIYTSHLNFIRSKEISMDNRGKFLQIHPVTKKIALREVQKALKSEIPDGIKRNFDVLIDSAFNFLGDFAATQVEKKKKGMAPFIESTSLACRSFQEINANWSNGICGHVRLQLKSLVSEDELEQLPQILKALFIELEAQGEIAYFKYDIFDCQLRDWLIFF